MSMGKQIKRKWGVLQRAISGAIMGFLAEYARTPSSKMFWAQLGVQPRQDAHGEPGDPALKRRRWVELWCRNADMITAFEAEYIRSTPHDAAWAARAAAFLHARLLVFHRQLRVEHPDVPELRALELDPATGKHRPRARAIDMLNAIHYCLYEDPENAEEDAKMMTDEERAEHAANGRRFRELIDGSPLPRPH